DSAAASRNRTVCAAATTAASGELGPSAWMPTTNSAAAPLVRRAASYMAACVIASTRDCKIEFGGTAVAWTAMAFHSVARSDFAIEAVASASANVTTLMIRLERMGHLHSVSFSGAEC